MSAILWMQKRLLTQPLVWIGLAVTAALWPATRQFVALGIASQESLESRVFYELVFLAMLLGSALVVGCVGRYEDLFVRASATRRIGSQGSAIASGAALFGVLAVGGPMLASPLRWGALFDLTATSVVVALHLSALGVLLLQVRLPPVVRAVLLPGLAWLLPALLDDAGGRAAWLLRVLDVSRPMVLPSPAALGRAFASIMGMILLSLLVASHPRRSS